jgi:hypothetical protein
MSSQVFFNVLLAVECDRAVNGALRRTRRVREQVKTT